VVSRSDLAIYREYIERVEVRLFAPEQQIVEACAPVTVEATDLPIEYGGIAPYDARWSIFRFTR